jgi:16S rRNA (guanine527-N7)-methyltransferase
MSLSDSLNAGLAQLKCVLDVGQQQQLLDYLALLARWNRAYNLTAVRDPARMMPLHLLDSLSIRPFLDGERVLDVGTGAGLPGIPLAVAEPRRQFVLLDSNGKKTRFVLQAVTTLGLQNVEVVQSRVEHYKSDSLFDTIMSRAFATLADFIQGCSHLLAPQGQLLAMKGKHPADELASLPDGWQCAAEHELVVPGVEAERRLLKIIRI